MNKKLLSGLCAAVLLSGLVGCGPKESKQNTTTSTSTLVQKSTNQIGILFLAPYTSTIGCLKNVDSKMTFCQ